MMAEDREAGMVQRETKAVLALPLRIPKQMRATLVLAVVRG
jgi:hypothetical protein